MNEPKIKPQFKEFAIAYCGDAKANAEQAAIMAGYSPRYARGNAHKLVARRDVQEYIQYLNTVGLPGKVNKIATVKEIQTFWTTVLNDTTLEIKDRLRASELLAKSRGAFNNEW